MREKSHILEQYQILNEKLLTSEFTFGFELEGIVEYGSEIFHQINEIDDESSIEYDDSNFYYRYDALGKIIDSMLMDDISPNMRKSLKGSSLVQIDGSVKPYSNSDYEDDENEDENYYSVGYNGNDMPFEYSSPIIPCTPNWFGKVIKLLSDLKYDGIYTNNTCGFHTHLRFGTMGERDVIWIYCNMASDPEFVNIFSQLDGIKLFSNKYANYDSIIKLGNAIQQRDYQKIFSYLTTDKYRVIRIHPQGTLEWRGPRGFMDNGVGFSYIKKFFKLLLKFINKIKTYMDTNILTGTTIEKKEFFDNLTSVSKKIPQNNVLEFIPGNINLRPTNAQSLSYKSAMKLKDVLIDKPEMIVPLIRKNPKTFEKFIKSLNQSSFINKIINKVLDSKAFNILSFDEKRNVMKVFIDNMNPSTIVKMKLGIYMTEQDIQKLYNQELLNNKLGLSAEIICQFIYMMYDAGCLKSLKQIEELLYKSISLNNFSLSLYFKNFGITANNDGRETIEEIIGEKNLVKLTLFVLNAYRTMGSRGNIYLYISDVNLSYFKDRIKKYGLAEKWDKIVFQLIKKYNIPYALLINPLSTEQLFYLIHDNKDMSSLSSEDRAKLRAYLH